MNSYLTKIRPRNHESKTTFTGKTSATMIESGAVDGGGTVCTTLPAPIFIKEGNMAEWLRR